MFSLKVMVYDGKLVSLVCKQNYNIFYRILNTNISVPTEVTTKELKLKLQEDIESVSKNR